MRTIVGFQRKRHHVMQDQIEMTITENGRSGLNLGDAGERKLILRLHEPSFV